MTSSIKYVGIDVHKASISIAVRNAAGKIVMECVIETKANTNNANASFTIRAVRMKRASKRQLQDLSKRKGEGRSRPLGGFGSSF
jgi:hypothetical protein